MTFFAPYQILIQSVCETVVPKLVAEDIPLLHSLLSDVFPGVKYTRAGMKELRAEIAKVCAEMHLVYGETGSQWVDKVCMSRARDVGRRLDRVEKVVGEV